MSQSRRKRPCGPSCLCERTQPTYYTHIPNMQDQLATCLLAIQEVGHSDCICRRCAEDLRRHRHDSGYVPVWKGGRRTSRVPRRCCVLSCTESGSVIQCSIAAPDTVELMLGLSIQKDGSSSTDLCSNHYQKFYRAYTQSLPCAACGRKLIKSQRFIRRCPKP